MRIISGECKGMKIKAPKGKITRPIPDRVKEALFSSLGSEFGTPGRIPPIAVMDIFAGSGAFGLEAVSRGAKLCCFVEKNRTAVSYLRENIERLKLSGRCWILTEDAFEAELPPAPEGKGWELLFLDPPYPIVEVNIDRYSIPELLKRISQSEILKEGALLILRHPSHMDFLRRQDKIIPYKTKTYGTMSFTWFRYEKQFF